MIDPTVQYLLEQAIDTPTKLQLLLMFFENPRLEITPDKMAERCCRDIWSVMQALHELAEDGILRVGTCIGVGDPFYSYVPRREYLEPIRQLMHAYDDPLERDCIQRTIRDLASYAPFRRDRTWESPFAAVS
ncbi:MAG: hypothetical protein ACLFVO_21700 [Chloroflexaceae bacterium]